MYGTSEKAWTKRDRDGRNKVRKHAQRQKQKTQAKGRSYFFRIFGTSNEIRKLPNVGWIIRVRNWNWNRFIGEGGTIFHKSTKGQGLRKGVRKTYFSKPPTTNVDRICFSHSRGRRPGLQLWFLNLLDIFGRCEPFKFCNVWGYRGKSLWTKASQCN